MTWESAQKRLEAGPSSALKLILIWLVILMGVGLGLRVIGGVFGWFGEAVTVAREEFGPRAMLQKYEWFKNASAQLDKLNADIRVYDGRQQALVAAYGETPRTAWPRDDRQEWSLISAEVAGVKASYNGLAAEYNSEMAKFNHAFANVGTLPQGADRALPREYRTYEVQ
jgi:hypothetical protein